MRILCLSYEYPPIGGGGSPVCAGIAESLVAAGHEVDVVTAGMPDLPREELINGVQVSRVRCVRRRRHMAGSLELATTLLPMYRRGLQLARKRRYEMIHCHFILPTGLVAWRLGAATGLPYVLTAHGSDVPGYNPDRFHLAHRCVGPAWRRVVRGAAAITSPSQFLAKLVRKRLDVPVRIVPNGMTIPARSEGPRVNRILMASRLFERKGVQDVLCALGGWQTAWPDDWQVAVAGDGPYRPTLERLAREQPVKVRFLKFVPRDELAELYRTSKIFVFPSHRENFPVTLLEAMGAGCAVIAANAAGNREVVGDAAINVAPGDVRSMQSSLRRLMHNDEEIARLSENSYQRVQRFAWDRVACEYEALFEQCLGGADVATAPTWPEAAVSSEPAVAGSEAGSGARSADPAASFGRGHKHEQEQIGS